MSVVTRTKRTGPLGRLTFYRAAPPRRWRTMLNRYPGKVLGVAAQFGSAVVSWVWPVTFNHADDELSEWLTMTTYVDDAT